MNGRQFAAAAGGGILLALWSKGSPAEMRGVIDKDDLSPGEAGASARREWQRRKQSREQRIRDAHPRLGGLIRALTDEPQSTSAWARGSDGEQLLGRRLDELAARGVVTALHDRRIPGGRANIDHIVVAPGGVFVIDAKHYKGQVERRDVGGLFRTDVRLYAGGRDCTQLVEGVSRQVKAVRQALASTPQTPAVPVQPVLCFVRAGWGLFTRPMRFGDVTVTWPKALANLLEQRGELSEGHIQAVARTLADVFPPA